MYDWIDGSPVRRIYLAPHGQCAGCQDDRTFHPLDDHVEWRSYNSVLWGGHLYRLLDARGFREGRQLERPIAKIRGEGKLLAEGEYVPKMISGSEVYVRLAPADNTAH